MRLFLMNTLLALAWIALTGTFTPVHFLFGFALGFSLLLFTQRRRPPTNYFSKVVQVLEFVLFFLAELVVANIRVLVVVLSPRLPISPAVVAIPLDVRSDTAITLLGNLITLTPGTLYLDVSHDRSVMYVHTMFVDDLDAFRSRIKQGFERRVMEILR